MFMCAKLFLSLHSYVRPVLLMYQHVFCCSYMHVLIVHMVISTPENIQIWNPDPRLNTSQMLLPLSHLDPWQSRGRQAVAVSELPGYPGRLHVRRAQEAYGWRKIRSFPLTVAL